MSESPKDSTEKQLPVVHKYEIPTKDGGTATLLYTDRAAWEAGGEENLKKAFLQSVDKSNVFVLLASEDTAIDYLGIDYPQYEDKPVEFLKALFSNDVKELMNQWPEDAQNKFWNDLYESSQDVNFQNAAHDTGKGIVFITMSPFSIGEIFKLKGDDALAKLLLLAHEFDHPDQEKEDTFTGTLEGEAESDSTGIKTVKSGDKDHSDITGQILFERSKQGISLVHKEEIFDTRSFFQKLLGFGKLDRFDHLTSALINPETGESEKVDDKTLEKSLLDLREKIVKQISPVLQSDCLKNQLDKATTSYRSFLNTDSIMSEFEQFLEKQKNVGMSQHKSPAGNDIRAHALQEQYQPFVQNYRDLEKQYLTTVENINRYYIKTESSDGTADILAAYVESPKDALRIMEEKGLDTKYPELMAALKDGAIIRENMINETKAAMATLEQENPELYKKFTTDSPAAQIILSVSLNNNKTSPEMNSMMYNILQDMKQKGSFDNDPVQMRVVDAFLNGVNTNPEKFDMEKIKTPTPQTEPKPAVQPAPKN